MSSAFGGMTWTWEVFCVRLCTQMPAKKAKAPRPMEAGLGGGVRRPANGCQAVSVGSLPCVLALRRATPTTAARPSKAITLASASGTGFTQGMANAAL